MAEVGHLATDLDRLRRGAGLSYRTLARRAGCPVSTLNDALTGRRFPRLDTVLAVARACGADVAEWRDRWLEADRIRAGRPDRAVERTPAELPHDVRGFAGRHAELTRLGKLVESADAIVMDGVAGVGKSALAVHWAHQVAGDFPDGQLFVDLRGHDPQREPLSASAALAQLLRSLGTPPAQVPVAQDEQASRYRSLMSGRRMLVLLDDAVAVDQVRPLLPGSPECLLLVTSRHMLTGLVARDGARHLSLDVLSDDDAHELLAEVLGRDRVGRERDAAGELIRLCGRLPLALRVAAALVATGTYRTMDELAARLREHNRLTALQIPGDSSVAVRAAFDLSYRALGAPTRRLFRLLGLVPGESFTDDAAGALMDAGDTHVRDLVTAHLVDEYSPGRYRFHDLLRDYAIERCHAEDSEQDRRGVREGLLDWYLRTADQADRATAPYRRHVQLPTQPLSARQPLEFADADQALAWFEAERTNLVAAIEAAADHRMDEISWQLCTTMWNFFDLRKHWSDWLSTHRTALAAARRLGDRYGEAWILNCLGIAYYDLRRYPDAIDCLKQALDIRQEVGDRRGIGQTFGNLGNAYRQLHRFDEAVDCLRQDLATCREFGDQRGAGISLNNLGDAYCAAGRFSEAVDCLREALAVRRETDDTYGEALTLGTLGEVYQAGGQHQQAIDSYRQALKLCRPSLEQWLTATLLTGLGRALHAGDQTDAATECWQAAVTIFDDLDDPQAADVRALLASGQGN